MGIKSNDELSFRLLQTKRESRREITVTLKDFHQVGVGHLVLWHVGILYVCSLLCSSSYEDDRFPKGVRKLFGSRNWSGSGGLVTGKARWLPMCADIRLAACKVKQCSALHGLGCSDKGHITRYFLSSDNRRNISKSELRVWTIFLHVNDHCKLISWPHTVCPESFSDWCCLLWNICVRLFLAKPLNTDCYLVLYPFSSCSASYTNVTRGVLKIDLLVMWPINLHVPRWQVGGGIWVGGPANSSKSWSIQNAKM